MVTGSRIRDFYGICCRLPAESPVSFYLDFKRGNREESGIRGLDISLCPCNGIADITENSDLHIGKLRHEPLGRPEGNLHIADGAHQFDIGYAPDGDGKVFRPAVYRLSPFAFGTLWRSGSDSIFAGREFKH